MLIIPISGNENNNRWNQLSAGSNCWFNHTIMWPFNQSETWKSSQDVWITVKWRAISIWWELVHFLKVIVNPFSTYHKKKKTSWIRILQTNKSQQSVLTTPFAICERKDNQIFACKGCNPCWYSMTHHWRRRSG